MCYSCYEDAGCPNIVNEKTKKAAELIKYLYEQDGCGVGGYAHIVVDDWNLEDSSIDWCILEAEKGAYEHIPEESRIVCIDVLNFLKELTESERYSTMAIADGFIQIVVTKK